MLLDVIADVARTKCELSTDRPIVVGVSGGADSLALMHVLFALGYQLVIAHLDHALRSESNQEADYVQSLAKSNGLPFMGARVDVKEAAAISGESLEEAARNVRYRFLFDCARQVGAQSVAVAHHADDQIETILMHFLRGAALSGLAGMPYRRIIPLWDQEIPVVRPLLDIWREEIEAYIDKVGIKPCIDVSNQDTTYFRNQLRHELIPELETYNPQFRKVLLRTVDVLREEKVLLDQLAREAWEKCLHAQTEERVILRVDPFGQLHKSLQRRLLRLAIAQLRPDLRDVGFEVVERGLAYIHQPGEVQEIDLIARLYLGIIKDRLILRTWAAELPDFEKPLLGSKNDTGVLGTGQGYNLRSGWRIEAELLTEIPDDVMAIIKEKGPHETWLDFDRLEMPLIVRSREEGERWQPLGMGGRSQKVSDFFINEKVLEHMRDLWPLVCSGTQIGWIVGMRPSEHFKVTHTTKRILILRLKRDK